MKIQIYLIASLLFMSSLNAQVDRSKIPAGGPAPKINLGKPVTKDLKNGMKLILVRNNKLPRVFFNLFLDNPPQSEGDKAGLSGITSSILGKGTKNYSKEEFIDEIDFMGANLNLGVSSSSGSSLSKFFPKLLNMMADGLLNPIFDEEEFNKSKERSIEGIKADENSVTVASRRVENILLFGKEDPISEYLTKESLNNIVFEDVQPYFKKNFIPNNAYFIIIGDFDIYGTINQIEYLFKKWKKGKVQNTNYISNEINETAIHFVDMPNAIQSEVTFQNSISMKMNNDDYIRLLVTNKILGGGPEARLEQQIRENKGYTYVARSSTGTNKYGKARFGAFTSTREEVTDSAVIEILNEIQKIRTVTVSEKELNDVKAKYFGNFVLATESPSTIASYTINTETQDLDEDFYKNYLSNINSVLVMKSWILQTNI